MKKLSFLVALVSLVIFGLAACELDGPVLPTISAGGSTTEPTGGTGGMTGGAGGMTGGTGGMTGGTGGMTGGTGGTK